MSRNYKLNFIIEAFNRARAISRKEALKKVEKKPSEREVFAIDYHPNLPSVSKIIKKHWSVMTENCSLERIFPKPSMVAYRRPKNLRDILFRAKISTKRSSSRRVNGCKPCNQMCTLCPFIQKTTTHKCERTGREWNIDAPIDCQTPNVV